MRKIKLMAFIMSVLSCVFLFSTGFANWYSLTVTTEGLPTGGSLTSYKALAIKNQTMTTFQYSTLSFKHRDSNGMFTNTDTGIITVEYVVPKETLTATDGTFKVTFVLDYADLVDSSYQLFINAFNEDNPDIENYYNIKLGETSLINNGRAVTTDDTIEYTYEFTVSKTSSNYSNNEFTSDYTFTISYELYVPKAITADSMNFYNSLGKYLRGAEGKSEDTPTKFIATASVFDT